MEEPVMFFEEYEQAMNNDIYSKGFVDSLLEDDEVSLEEAAFMTGYADHA